ncbi:FOG: Predicted E3 ubiquitin ligase [Ceraceosorus bombacis]|uniref:FOG: Predicted E3 ubiquitin ligase n=1 Tax=Ceraceosorus bombacis TaxID=401625 RepID=A0A0P1BN37_9BASI|nr:FOG: Predicted E3 ubiquitin ligase [Ceraceosorus bombacis]
MPRPRTRSTENGSDVDTEPVMAEARYSSRVRAREAESEEATEVVVDIPERSSRRRRITRSTSQQVGLSEKQDREDGSNIETGIIVDEQGGDGARTARPGSSRAHIGCKLTKGKQRSARDGDSMQLHGEDPTAGPSGHPQFESGQGGPASSSASLSRDGSTARTATPATSPAAADPSSSLSSTTESSGGGASAAGLTSLPEAQGFSSSQGTTTSAGATHATHQRTPARTAVESAEHSANRARAVLLSALGILPAPGRAFVFPSMATGATLQSPGARPGGTGRLQPTEGDPLDHPSDTLLALLQDILGLGRGATFRGHGHAALQGGTRNASAAGTRTAGDASTPTIDPASDRAHEGNESGMGPTGPFGQGAARSDDPSGEQAQPTGAAREEPRPRVGTTVIVQGALISRTIPPRAQGIESGSPHATVDGPSDSTDRPTQTQSFLGAQSQTQAEAGTSATSSRSSEPSARSSSQAGGTRGQTAQAATLVEQADMLSHLCSVAAAATAASLISGPSGQAPGGSNSGAGTGSTAAEIAQGIRGNMDGIGYGRRAMAPSAAAAALRRVSAQPSSAARAETSSPSITVPEGPSDRLSAHRRAGVAPVWPFEGPFLPSSRSTGQRAWHRASGSTGGRSRSSISSVRSSASSVVRSALRHFVHGIGGVFRRNRTSANAREEVSTTSLFSDNGAAAQERSYSSPQAMMRGERGAAREALSSLVRNIFRRTQRGSFLASAEPSFASQTPAESRIGPTLARAGSFLAGHTRGPSNESPRRSLLDITSTNIAGQRTGESPHEMAALLERARGRELQQGQEGSWERFMYNLSRDLAAAVRDLPAPPSDGPNHGESQESAAQQHSEQESNTDGSGSRMYMSDGSIDGETRTRRQQDIQHGQLAFYRLFRFNPTPVPASAQTGDQSSTPLQPSASPSGPSRARASSLPRSGSEDAIHSLPWRDQATFGSTPRSGGQNAQTSPSTLVPCVVIGVRSLGANEPGGLFGVPVDPQLRDAPPGAAAAATGEQAQSANPSAGGEARSNVDTSTSAQAESVSDTNYARYLLFIGGGTYSSDHPLLQASPSRAAQDLMLAMEILSRVNGMRSQPNTLTQEQIESANLVRLVPTRDTIAKHVAEGELRENTAEKCLICLEDWESACKVASEARETDGSSKEHEARLLKCGHLFHAHCVDQWAKSSSNSCPLCRAQIVRSPGAPPSAPHVAPAAAGPAGDAAPSAPAASTA